MPGARIDVPAAAQQKEGESSRTSSRRRLRATPGKSEETTAERGPIVTGWHE